MQNFSPRRRRLTLFRSAEFLACNQQRTPHPQEAIDPKINLRDLCRFCSTPSRTPHDASSASNNANQRRRRTNSTFHNMWELLKIRTSCGCCCLSMKAAVALDMLSTMMLPAAMLHGLSFVCTVFVAGEPISQLTLMLFGESCWARRSSSSWSKVALTISSVSLYALCLVFLCSFSSFLSTPCGMWTT